MAITAEHSQDIATGLPYQGTFLWNNIRGLDVLESLPQVDKTRIGVTGTSGGGMQTMDLAAVDPRIKCAVIVAYPVCFHQLCYINIKMCCAWPRSGAMRFMDQEDMIAMIAPRPTAVFTLTGDWTANSIDHELREVAAVHDLFDAEAGPNVKNVGGQQPYRLMTSGNGRFLAEALGRSARLHQGHAANGCIGGWTGGCGGSENRNHCPKKTHSEPRRKLLTLPGNVVKARAVVGRIWRPRCGVGCGFSRLG